MVGVKAVRLLVLDPDLGSRLTPAELARARREVLLLGFELPRGPVDLDELLSRSEVRGRPAGLVVLEGVIVERVELGDRPCARLAGAGDLLRLPLGSPLPLALEASFDVLQPAFVAMLDDRFLAAGQRWPGLAGAMLDRAISRQQESLLRKAIAQLPRVEDRLMALFRVLAERWGRQASDGIVVELALTHDLIGELIGARRPTVSLGLRTLAENGQLRLVRGDGWLLTGEASVGVRMPTMASPPADSELMPARTVVPELLLIGVGEALARRLQADVGAVRMAADADRALAVLSGPETTAVVVIDLARPGIGEHAVVLVEGLRAHRETRVIALTEPAIAMRSEGVALLEAAAHDRLLLTAEPQHIVAAAVEQLSISRSYRPADDTSEPDRRDR